MLNELDKLTNNNGGVTTLTENGALTLATSGSKCLDLFSSIGAWRGRDDGYIIKHFAEAFNEDKLLAMRILFYTRDVRGGLGERRVFRILLKWLAENCPEALRPNLMYVPFFGRFDDLWDLLDTELCPEVIAMIKQQLDMDLENLKAEKPISLLGKWLPSSNTSSKQSVRHANKIAKKLGWKISDYRKTVSKLRRAIDIVETRICRALEIDFPKLPGQALKRYTKLFFRRYEESFNAYLESVNKGEAKMNADTLLPCDIVHKLLTERWSKRWDEMSQEEIGALDTMWKQLPDFTNSGNNIAVVDVSGSMFCHGSGIAPIDVSVSLGLYFAEHNTGCFRGTMLTFSAKPKLVFVKGSNIKQKVENCTNLEWGGNTDIKAVFDVILQAALNKKAKPEEMPQTIYIISDMEFDDCTSNADVTNYELAKCTYARYGYKLPGVVFWNVDSRNSQVPVAKDEIGTALVSGYTPRLFGMIFSVLEKTPMDIMLEIIGTERYQRITVGTAS
ncbi:DUF2828 family protein [bacterium]|nr:DUF2828 family protein [bacterium]